MYWRWLYRYLDYMFLSKFHVFIEVEKEMSEAFLHGDMNDYDVTNMRIYTNVG